MKKSSFLSRPFIARVILAAAAAFQGLAPSSLLSQEEVIVPVELSVGRSQAIDLGLDIKSVAVAVPEIADFVLIGPREAILTGKVIGETDVFIWTAEGRRHLRVTVRPPSDKQQVILYIKLAEVRKDMLRQIGISNLYRNGSLRLGSGTFGNDNSFSEDGSIVLPSTGFATVLAQSTARHLLTLIDIDEKKGLAHTLAEPSLMAGDRDSATFLAGGEVPIPVVQSAAGAVPTVSLQFKEFGVRLGFRPTILANRMVMLSVSPEVSSVDFVNGVVVSGINIPGFRTRRVSTTLNVADNNSVIISGLFDGEQERIRTGIPLLQDLPFIGKLFSSTRWQQNRSELIVVVTPVIVDPASMPPGSTLNVKPSPTPAIEAIKSVLKDTSGVVPPAPGSKK